VSLPFWFSIVPGGRALKGPATVTLVPLPPYSPEPGPGERIWLYLRERFLSLRVFKDDLASVDACCEAWNRLIADRIPSLCHQPCIATLTSSAQRYDAFYRKNNHAGGWRRAYPAASRLPPLFRSPCQIPSVIIRQCESRGFARRA
jgi:hypothetical protein